MTVSGPRPLTTSTSLQAYGSAVQLPPSLDETPNGAPLAVGPSSSASRSVGSAFHESTTRTGPDPTDGVTARNVA